MKTRFGFISNSSSTSFIIAFDPNTQDLNNSFTSQYSDGIDSTGIVAVGINEVFENLKRDYIIEYPDHFDYFESNISYSQSMFIKFCSIISKSIRTIESGRDVAIIKISYGDEGAEENLNDFEIIERQD